MYLAYLEHKSLTADDAKEITMICSDLGHLQQIKWIMLDAQKNWKIAQLNGMHKKHVFLIVSGFAVVCVTTIGEHS